MPGDGIWINQLNRVSLYAATLFLCSYCTMTRWICSEFSIAPVSRGKAEAILPLNRKSWCGTVKLDWGGGYFPLSPLLFGVCHQRGGPAKLVSFLLLSVLWGKIGVPTLWVQQCQQHPVHPVVCLPSLSTILTLPCSSLTPSIALSLVHPSQCHRTKCGAFQPHMFGNQGRLMQNICSGFGGDGAAF